MTSINRLIDPLLDRLAARLAVKVQKQLDGAFDAALQRAEQRLEAAARNLETRLVDAATRAIVGTGLQVGMESTLERTEQIIDATEKALESTMFTAGVVSTNTKPRSTDVTADLAAAAKLAAAPLRQLRERIESEARQRRTKAEPERPDR